MFKNNWFGFQANKWTVYMSYIHLTKSSLFNIYTQTCVWHVGEYRISIRYVSYHQVTSGLVSGKSEINYSIWEKLDVEPLGPDCWCLKELRGKTHLGGSSGSLEKI